MKARFIPLLWLCFALLTATAYGAEPARQVLPMGNSTVTITAEKMSFANQTGEITFSGSVHVVRDDVELRAGRLLVTLQPGEGGKRRGIQQMVAEQEVQFSQGTRTASAGHAIYDPVAETVVLTDHPKVTDPSLEVVGTRITINLATQESTVDGGALTFTESPE